MSRARRASAASSSSSATRRRAAPAMLTLRSSCQEESRCSRSVLVNAAMPLACQPTSSWAAVARTAAHDDVGWQASGMAAFTSTLREHLDSSWQDDLSVSIAGAARRLVAELLDEAALARRARDMLSTRQAGQVSAFREHLDRLGSRRDDAEAAALAHLTRLRAALDEDAAAVIAPTCAAVHRDLDARLAQLPAASAADLETAGWAAMTALIVDAVGGWRAAWSLS